ncbi:MAG: hypothetical protein E6R00_11855 [Gammaproteobacteria bacterium]|nr:MAG: hypothetical protein E6R00_11855 [Gammaproteobacteria bacterium]
MQLPILLTLRRSRQLSLVVLGLHTLVASSLLLSFWPPLLSSPLLVAVSVSAWRVLRPPPFVALCLRKDDQLDLLLGDGQRISATVAPGTAVFPGLIVLRARDREGTGRRTLVLLPDSVAAGEFRRLRLWLRWSAALRPGDGDDAG